MSANAWALATSREEIKRACELLKQRSNDWVLEASEEVIGRIRELLKRCDNEKWAQVVTELPTMTNMYAPKQPCPRDLGYWYCGRCVRGHFKEQSELDFPIQIRGCGEVFGSRVCGRTHLGFVRCDECKAAGRAKPHPHIGEFEIVTQVREGTACAE